MKFQAVFLNFLTVPKINTSHKIVIDIQGSLRLATFM